MNNLRNLSFEFEYVVCEKCETNSPLTVGKVYYVSFEYLSPSSVVIDDDNGVMSAFPKSWFRLAETESQYG